MGSTLRLRNFAENQWTEGKKLVPVYSAITGEVIAETGSDGLNFGAMVDYARKVGGPALRKLTFHERAAMLKALGNAIMARKEELYQLSYSTGATKVDSWIDIEGGAGTLFSFASKGQRELPNDRILIDGDPEIVSKGGTWIGQHVYTSLQGVGVLINAFNFPVWGMLEKLGPALLAGVPVIVKPASATAYVAEAAFRIMTESNVLPPGAIQLISGSAGDLLDHMTCQDLVSFTGSATTAMKLQSHPVMARESVRFVAERDSLNGSILAPDAYPDAPEFDLFVKEVVKEMTVKAGQKCTAIRRAFVPEALMDKVQAAISARLEKMVIGDPRLETTRMGALASMDQLKDVRAKVAELGAVAKVVYGDPAHVKVSGEGMAGGAFIADPAAHRRPVACGRRARCGSLRPCRHHHALQERRRCHRAGQPRQGIARDLRLHL
jgi:oxepin-CoA hydrolase/3-oxo-5,6-dehydrosuberyl-CoA semialdehyde dehydrogenase